MYVPHYIYIYTYTCSNCHINRTITNLKTKSTTVTDWISYYHLNFVSNNRSLQIEQPNSILHVQHVQCTLHLIAYLTFLYTHVLPISQWTDVNTQFLLLISLKETLLHYAIRPRTGNVWRLSRIAEVSTMHQTLQHLQYASYMSTLRHEYTRL